MASQGHSNLISMASIQFLFTAFRDALTLLDLSLAEIITWFVDRGYLDFFIYTFINNDQDHDK